jgi:uncharacterized membrane protein YgdD (TMEM256/DUF423 family)
MHKRYISIAALFGALAVVLGAFGAHSLQKATSDAVILHSYQTAVQYQMYHALVLLMVGILFDKFSSPLLHWCARFFVAGIVLFSGSLYLLTYLKLHGAETKWVGPITPLGGLLFIAGWVFLLLSVLKKS